MNRKILILIIVIIIIMGFYTVRVYSINAIIERDSKQIKDAILDIISSHFEGVRTESKTYSEVSEISDDIESMKAYSMKLFEQFKEDGEIELEGLTRPFYCKDESGYYIMMYEDEDIEKCEDIKVITEEGVTKYMASGVAALNQLMQISIRILNSEYSLDVLSENKIIIEQELYDMYQDSEKAKEYQEKLDKIHNSISPARAQFLDLLENTRYLGSIYLWQGQFTQNVYFIDWENKTSEKIIKMEEFVNGISIPTKAEIRQMKTKEWCLQSFEDLDIVSYYDSIKLPDNLETILFIERMPDKICENLAEYKENNLIKMAERSKNEKNAFLSFLYKVYLNSVVKCGHNMYIEDNKIKEYFCDYYLEPLKRDFIDAINN